MNQDFLDAGKSILEKDYKKNYFKATRRTHFISGYIYLVLESLCLFLLYLFYHESMLLTRLTVLNVGFLIACILLKNTWPSNFYFSTRLCWFHHLFGYFLFLLDAFEKNCNGKTNLGLHMFSASFVLSLLYSIYWYKRLEIRYSKRDHPLREENPKFDNGDAYLILVFLIWRTVFAHYEIVVNATKIESTTICV